MVIEFNLIGYKYAEGKIGVDWNLGWKVEKFGQNSLLWNLLYYGA